MSDDLLPPALAAHATTQATTILHRLSDRALVAGVADATARIVGRSIWEPGSSLYAGAAGCALAFGHAARVRPDSSERWHAQARGWLKLAAEHTRNTPVPVAGLSHGTAGIALAVAESNQDGRYTRTLRALHLRLAEQVRTHRPSDGHRLSFHDYDVFAGPAGILGHVSRHLADDAARQVATTLTERIVARCRTEAPDAGADQQWTSWLIPRENYPLREEEHELYPYGYVDLGLAHGLPGPLAALSRARLAGLRVRGLPTAIRALTDQMVAASYQGRWGRGWPRVMPFDESGRPAPDTGHPSSPAYCYGAPGITSALLDAADALGDSTVRAVAVEGFTAALRQLGNDPVPPSPGLCHGDAGLALICHQFVTRTGNEEARAALVPLVERLVSRCDPDHPLVVRDFLPPEGGEPGSPLAGHGDGAWVDTPGLLDGAAGVALTLLSVATRATPRWARAVLVG